MCVCVREREGVWGERERERERERESEYLSSLPTSHCQEHKAFMVSEFLSYTAFRRLANSCRKTALSANELAAWLNPAPGQE